MELLHSNKNIQNLRIKILQAEQQLHQSNTKFYTAILNAPTSNKSEITEADKFLKTANAISKEHANLLRLTNVLLNGREKIKQINSGANKCLTTNHPITPKALLKAVSTQNY